jgi:hypothetical protein
MICVARTCADLLEGVCFWWEEVFPQRTRTLPVAYVGQSQPSVQVETKVSKWDMPEELLLLLEKVEKEGPGAILPYVRLNLSPVSPHLVSLHTLDNPASHWPSPKAQVQPVNPKTLWR